MKILLVGPGIMPIPSQGWGAVETVIWQQKVHLEKLGHTVDILNKRGYVAAFKAKPQDYDLVHLHYDELAGFWIRLAQWMKLPLVITTHYGYGAYPERWDGYYKKIFNTLLGSPAMLVLSDEIAAVFKNSGYKGWIGVLPNGTETSDMAFKPKGNGRAICLGKVEPRKQQAKLAASLAGTGVACDFVGPLVDKNFSPNDKETHYLGTWTREEVHAKLTEYSCLVLASDGEAHALVVLEAMAAGLSLALTHEASANLDLTKPWVAVHDAIGDDFIKDVARLCKENDTHRSGVHTYALDNFDWLAVAKKYTEQAALIIASHAKAR